LSDSATDAEISWAELLLTVLEDGLVTSEEISALDDLATNLGLSEESIHAAKKKLLVCIAREAWRDGKVSRVEKSDVQFVANLLQLSDKEAKDSLDEVELARIERLNRKTKPLPTDWQYGEPLRIGDRVVFTGCYELNRSGMEVDAVRAGLKVTGSISKKSSLLVTDQTINGVKDSAAIELGIRRVSPSEFTQLLEFIQPASVTKKVSRARRQKLTASES
jgi:DNA polymerase-3 subunit epsilon